MCATSPPSIFNEHQAGSIAIDNTHRALLARNRTKALLRGTVAEHTNSQSHVKKCVMCCVAKSFATHNPLETDELKRSSVVIDWVSVPALYGCQSFKVFCFSVRADRSFYNVEAFCLFAHCTVRHLRGEPRCHQEKPRTGGQICYTTHAPFARSLVLKRNDRTIR